MKVSMLLLTLPLMLLGCSNNGDEPSADESSQLPISSDQNQFLIDNAARRGVMVTDSGLQYEVLRAADGPKPNAQSTVTVHYVGNLTDGTEFDSSYARGEPSTFVLSGTITGWVEAVQLMSIGAQYRFVMPANLAYGDRGAGTVIQPGATLIFEIELLEINVN